MVYDDLKVSDSDDFLFGGTEIRVCKQTDFMCLIGTEEKQNVEARGRHGKQRSCSVLFSAGLLHFAPRSSRKWISTRVESMKL